MSGTTKSGRLPRLRFPEFRGAGEWVEKQLGIIAKISAEKVRDASCIPMSITSGVGLVSQMVKFGRIIAGNSYANYLILKKNYFAYNKSATKEYPEGFIALYLGDELAAVPKSVFTCFYIKGESPVPKYINYLFLDNLHGKWLRKFLEVGARAHGSLSITDDDLLALPIPIPSGKTSVLEQQKIADCLSSLDDLITLEAQKLDSLKAHKKGLMQQLFPREGETQPRLRFPEFQNAGEWEENKLRDFASFFKGKGISKANIATNGRFLCIRYGEIYTRYGEVINEVASRTDMADSELFFGKINDIIIPASGESKLDIAKASCVMLDNVALGSDLNIIRTKHNGTFLSYYLNGPKRLNIAKVAQGDTVAHLYPGQLGKVDLFLPGKLEQQRIASCLTSLDDLITAQTQKLEALKTNKKGLMQQLFPQVSEE